MDIDTYAAPADFAAVAGPVLEAEALRNNLMLGILERLLKNPHEYGGDPFLATAMEGGEVALVALMTPPFPLQFYARRPDDATLKGLVDALRGGGWSVPAVMASPEHARAFAEQWSGMGHGGYRPGMSTRLHVLHAVADIDDSPGTFTIARAEHTDQVVDWLQAFHEEAVPEDPFDAERVRKVTERRIADGAIALWVDGVPVSTALRTRPMLTNESVSGVYTPPELRGRGYATSCVAHLSRAILAAGKRYCCLFTDLTNPTSNKIYARIGYQPVADFQRYDFDVQG